MLQLPESVLLPLSEGALLVSPTHAVFCRIVPQEAPAVEQVLTGQAPLGSLSQALLKELERHGFFGPPRRAKDDPPTVQLQLTNRCNLACKYCCTNSGRPRPHETTYEQFVEVLQQIPEAFGRRTGVALLGGEPLLVPWALPLAETALKQGLELTIFTNGVPLAERSLAEAAARLMRQGLKIRLSLSGPTQASCDDLAGAQRFAAALAGIHNLARAGGAATVDLMLTPQQAREIAAELPQLRRRLPPKTPLALGVLYLSGRETGQHLFASRLELEEALDRVAFEAGEVIPAAQPAPLAYRREGCGCAAGHHIHMRSDGALFNCFKMEEQIGRLGQDSFLEAAAWAQAHPHTARESRTCRDCPMNTLCGGGCRSENMLYTGDANEPPCGAWRVRVLSELLAEERVSAVEWPVGFLWQEAKRRGIEAPEGLGARFVSRHLVD